MCQCLQLLSIILIEHVSTNAPAPATNLFAIYVAKLHRPSDFEFLITGFTNLFSTVLNHSSIISTSINVVTKSPGIVDWTTEALILFMVVASLNHRFLPALMRTAGVDTIVVNLLAIAALYKDDTGQAHSPTLTEILADLCTL